MSDYEEMTNDELREELESRELKTSGNKDELIERLEADDAAVDDDAANLGDATPAEPPSDDGDAAADEPADDDTPLTSASNSPGRAQVIKEDGWTVQRGSWRKGAGKAE